MDTQNSQSNTLIVLDISNEDLRKGFARELYWHVQDLHSLYFSKWQSLNISRMRAREMLNLKIQDIEPYKDYEQQNLDVVEPL
ncbi:MAG: hypothetical protein AAB407_00860 [Patescibacteria group bacterium]